jgi:hypothetical protein
MRSLPPELEVLGMDGLDPRLAGVGDEPTAWSDGETLTIAVRRRSERAPELVGSHRAPLVSAGGGVWGVRLRVRGLDRACIEYGVLDADSDRLPVRLRTWRGARAPDPVPVSPNLRRPPERAVLDESSLAREHPAWLWVPDSTAALTAIVLCADGAGIGGWASAVAPAVADGRLPPVALVGIDGIGIRLHHGRNYDIRADPRARAYLPDLDPPYFERHMTYATQTVPAWAERRLARTFTAHERIVFGCSNGAAWAAAVAAIDPPIVGGALVFSLGRRPPSPPSRRSSPPHALVAGRLEPGFDRETSRHARALRRRGVAVRLIRPIRGHDHSMWTDELVPALAWVLDARGARPT